MAEEPIEPDDANAPPDDVEPAAPAEEAQEAEAPEDAEAREEAEAPEEAETPPPVEMESEEASEEEPEVVSPYAPLPEPATDCDTAPECNTRGFRYYQAKDYERALPYFSAALERDPGHVKAVYNAACMFALLEDMDASITMLERLAKMDDPEAQKRIRKVARDGDFDRIRNQSKFRQAMRELRR